MARVLARPQEHADGRDDGLGFSILEARAREVDVNVDSDLDGWTDLCFALYKNTAILWIYQYSAYIIWNTPLFYMRFPAF